MGKINLDKLKKAASEILLVGAEMEHDAVIEHIRKKIAALKSDPSWVKSPAEATIVGAYSALLEEIESGIHFSEEEDHP